MNGRRAAGAADFDAFVVAHQDRVRRALVPVAGADAAREATVDGLVHVWQHWDRVAAMANPAGYLYTVARSRVRHERRTAGVLPEELVGPAEEPTTEPALVGLLANLPERQKVAVYLVHGCGWSAPDVADLLGISATTVRTHAERGLARLRRHLEVAP